MILTATNQRLRPQLFPLPSLLVQCYLAILLLLSAFPQSKNGKYEEECQRALLQPVKANHLDPSSAFTLVQPSTPVQTETQVSPLQGRNKRQPWLQLLQVLHSLLHQHNILHLHLLQHPNSLPHHPWTFSALQGDIRTLSQEGKESVNSTLKAIQTLLDTKE